MALAPETDASDLDALQWWFKDYWAEDARQMTADSQVVQDVTADDINEDAHNGHIDSLMHQVQVKSGLCSKCQHIFNNTSFDFLDKHFISQTPESEYKVLGSFRIDQIEAAAKRQCCLCGLVFQVLKDHHLYSLYSKIEARLDRLDANAACTFSVTVSKGDAICHLWLDFPGKPCNSRSIRRAAICCNVASSTEEYTSDNDSLALAKTWLHECVQHHEICSVSEKTSLPTRLIAVESEVIRLVETADWISKPHYCALSHAWGDEVPFKLTAKNYGSLLSAIPLDELPKTFVEAVHFTRSLGISFLWIDSLCIVQDNEDDWRKESSTMRDVYGGSTLTLAASSARDSTGGFYLKPSVFCGGARVSARVNGVQRTLNLFEPDYFEAATTESHLATRAWAVQERLLSRRMIHIGDRGAAWECRQRRATEYIPEVVEERWFSGRQKSGLRSAWDEVVTYYSGANLSVGRDKLPALSGIAQETFTETPDEYLAGLWRTDLIYQLQWCPRQPRRRPPYRAPSWSWASVDGEVFPGAKWDHFYDNPRCQSHAFFWDYKPMLSGEDTFGGVDEARLRLTCAFMAACRPYHWTPHASLEPTEIEVRLVAPVTAPTVREHIITCALDCVDDMIAPTELLYLLPLNNGRIAYDGEHAINSWHIEGLLLQPTGFRNGEFRRVGFFNCSDWDIAEIPNIWQKGISSTHYFAFMDFLDNFGDEIARAACEEVVQNTDNPDYPYLITIV